MSDYDPMRETWHNRGVRAADHATRKPWATGALAYLGGIGALVLVVVAITVVVLVGWQIGWWFSNANANREAHLIRNSYSNQQTLREQITQNIGNVLSISTQIAEASGSTAQALRAQRVAVLGIVCQDASEVTGDPLATSQASFVNANCEAGNVKPGSSYTTGVNP